MGKLDNLISDSTHRQESSGVQENKYKMLMILSNIAYYVGLFLLPISIVILFIAMAEGKGYIGGIFLGCFIGGVNGLFFGLTGKCLIDIYNKVSQD
ncbi:hypothetical protein HMPREF9151_00315 [Hoylesella saccharolytica F0055]|uniref:Uncharacterized protein n=1 Tax=Hoylesella saccharolytica F0055 TaxID=1127699 RepID=L1NJ41_9BACT|nr:hypothetical protein [Hoylesella saccharolytica]EKY03544.1 hypothetical protein HMPREF9151_00315 [Hoylesella saccharolytica F0055]